MNKIDTIASDKLTITMTSDDGIIEGVELIDNEHFIIAFQFHPEILVSFKDKDLMRFINNLNKEIDIFIKTNKKDSI